MAGAFVDGALKGFNMMERHQSRMFNEQRLSDLDKRNDQRYQQQQGRLADMDKRDEERYQAQQGRLSDLDKERVANREQDVKWRESQGEQAEEQRQWQRNWQQQQAQWQKDEQAIPIAWQSFRQTGQIPDDLSDVLERNKGMDPRTYLNPEYREQVKGLGEKLDSVIKTGKMAEANSPETVQLFDKVFKDKIQASVGQYDEDVKSKIVGVDFAGFVPVEEKGGRVGLALKVTYENGSQEVKPMTKGRTSEGDDPVMTYTPKELIGTVKARVMMADMMERPEYWDQMGAQIGASFGQRSQPKEAPKEAEYRKAKVQLLEAKAKALSDIESGKGATMPLTGEAKAQALAGVEAQFSNQLKQLESIYGATESASNDSQQKQSSKDLDSLSDDELLQQLTGAIGAQ
ncbi:hypothetical protein FQP85_20740 [Pseudoalteromonas neustonica]|uniref:Uncharacterized protein n=1 Tax=Pseudoalteromonas neustonica TaxID=1840331 RepID=A0ABY3F845_9GAMM|nr:hypothetical protein [Pseudoalteromonas neustonica]TVU80210.1 hypothetical protein FQP85_20740 [Pseudoalteromonas neustonica]